jgi:transposase
MVSLEKRELISKANKRGTSIKDMSENYDVPQRTIYGLLAHERKTGSMEPLVDNCGRNPEFSPQDMEKLKGIIEEKNDVTLEEMKAQMDTTLCISALSRIVKHKLGFNFKKNFARERAGHRDK